MDDLFKYLDIDKGEWLEDTAHLLERRCTFRIAAQPSMCDTHDWCPAEYITLRFQSASVTRLLYCS